jgi:hypothetical protein
VPVRAERHRVRALRSRGLKLLHNLNVTRAHFQRLLAT